MAVNPMFFPAGIKLPVLSAVGQYAEDEALPRSIIEQMSSGGFTTLQEQWLPQDTIYPNVDATNGPITADTLVAGDLSSPAGMTFYQYDAVDIFTGNPIFNYQGMIPAVAPAGILSAAGRSCMMNAFTPRWFNGNAGQYYNGNQVVRVGVASTRVVFVFYVGQGQISATTVDNHLLVEHQGKMCHLSSGDTAADGLPKVISGGSGIYRRDETFKAHRYREFQLEMGPNCYFIGMWADTIGEVRRTKNKPQLFVSGVDSWQDPITVVGGDTGGFTGSDYQCWPQHVIFGHRTGMATGTDGQGGTGEINPNGTSGGDLDTYAGNRSSAAWSDSRVNWRRDYWSTQYPIFLDVGGWNDGTGLGSLGTPYRDNYRARIAARIQKTIDRISAAGRDVRFVEVGIQPADVVVNDVKWMGALGQTDVPALFPGYVLGQVPLLGMWPDNSTTGPRSLYCNSSDRIHLLAIGDQAVTGYYAEKIGNMPIDLSYLNKTRAALTTLYSPPSS